MYNESSCRYYCSCLFSSLFLFRLENHDVVSPLINYDRKCVKAACMEKPYRCNPWYNYTAYHANVFYSLYHIKILSQLRYYIIKESLNFILKIVIFFIYRSTFLQYMRSCVQQVHTLATSQSTAQVWGGGRGSFQLESQKNRRFFNLTFDDLVQVVKAIIFYFYLWKKVKLMRLSHITTDFFFRKYCIDLKIQVFVCGFGSHCMISCTISPYHHNQYTLILICLARKSYTKYMLHNNSSVYSLCPKPEKFSEDERLIARTKTKLLSLKTFTAYCL